MKTWLRLMMCALLMLTSLVSIDAQQNEYEVIHLYDGSLIASFSNFEEAYQTMNLTENTGVLYQNKLIAMDYGVAVLRHDNCEVNITTVHHVTDETGYVNGCYGNDAQYIRTNSSGTWALVQMAGAQMWVRLKDITLVPYHDGLQLSTYFVDQGRLYHQIKTVWESDSYGSLIDLGQAPDELDEGNFYFSYDGHYFYTDFQLMHQDTISNHNDHAVNSQAYYNYFMMLPHRSVTSYSLDDFNELFDLMHMNHAPSFYTDENKDSINDVISVSQFIGALDSFLFTQAEFGSNALLMLSLSMNESASGNSSLAYRRNNLFGHAAYDSDVEGNARRYLSVQNSVISHGKNYVSNSYANPDKFMYHGSFFGDKNSGMGVSYASDPYWSSKAAQFAYELDEMLGQNDLNREALAVVENQDQIHLFDDAYQVIDTIKNVPLMSFVVIEEFDQYYRVQLDRNRVSLSGQNDSYDFEKNTALIRKSIVDVVLNEDKIHRKNFVTYVFNASGGSFLDGTDTKMIQFEQGLDPICELPVMEGSIFEKWNQVSKTEYEAVYKKIKSIEMHTLPDQVTELNVPISVSDGSIKVIYEDNSYELVDLTMSMVSDYDLSVSSDHNVIVTYGGVSTSYPLHVSMHLDEVRRDIFKEIDDVLDHDHAEAEKLIELKELMQDEFYPVLTMNQIKNLDQIYQLAFGDQLATIISDNTYDLQVSGLYLSLNEADKSNLFGDYVKIDITQADVDERLINTAAAQGWTIEDQFHIEMKHNGASVQSDGPLIFSITRPDQQKKRWAVMTLADDEIIMCHTTTQLSRIRFKSYGSKQYVLVSKTSVNDSMNAEITEVVTMDDNNFVPYILSVVFNGIVMVLMAGLMLAGLICIKNLKKRSR